MKSERRRLGQILIFAVLVTVLAFVSGGCAADTDTYTVCASGCNYISIQAAIDAAQPGDTIEVHSGVYYENVNVNRQLILRGKDTGGGKPVVDAGSNGSAIALSQEGIVLDGFTAIHASNYGRAGILIYSHNNTVINNSVTNNDYGIYLDSSYHNNLTENTASNNSDYGIYLYSSCHNNLTGNTVSDNDYGIYLDSSSNNNTLTGNTALNNYDGILLYLSCHNHLTGNSAHSNSGHGIYLYSSCNNNLTGNTAHSNSGHGFYVRLSSNNNNLTGNTAHSNNDHGFYLRLSSNNNTLTGNTASNNSDYGIFLYTSNNNHIYNNYFDNALNTYDSGSNIWNITPTPGLNIIGGSWLGGNYWNDYTGEDTTGDGLGDSLLPYNASGNIVHGGDWLPLVTAAEKSIFDTGEGTSLSISGTFTGTITPSRNLNVSTLYTYSCPGTGGHTKSIQLYEDGTVLASGVWGGYTSDWHNISITPSVMLLKGHEYCYVIETGSYPGIIHASSYTATGGVITCTEFVDVNGRRHEGWIPAIRLEGEGTTDADGAVSVVRDLPDAVSPDEKFNVSLTQSGFLLHTGIVTETLPAGFTYVLGSLRSDIAEYDEATKNLTIYFKGVTSITYLVEAGTAEQIENAAFSGIWKTADIQLNKLSGEIEGDTGLALAVSPSPTPDNGG